MHCHPLSAESPGSEVGVGRSVGVGGCRGARVGGDAGVGVLGYGGCLRQWSAHQASSELSLNV